tara:strand:+ start:208 stop:648 length:441 start_codon:yes stop_codon:yes gene_type:complete
MDINIKDYKDFEPVKDLDCKVFNYKGTAYNVQFADSEQDWALFCLYETGNTTNEWDIAVDFKATYAPDDIDQEDPILGEVINVEVMDTYNKNQKRGTFEGFGFELDYKTNEILYMPIGIWYAEDGPVPKPDLNWKERVKQFVEESA